MLAKLASENLGVALLLWAVLYTSDYYLTLLASRMYKQAASETLIYQGGIELTPQFRDDVASIRLLSPRWIRALLISGGLLALLWFGTVPLLGAPEAFAFVLGGVLLLEAAVHTRHLRVLMLFRRFHKGQGPKGRIEYPRWLLLDQSGVESAGIGLLYLFIFVFTGSIFVFGGVVFTLALGLRHWMCGRKELARPNSA